MVTILLISILIISISLSIPIGVGLGLATIITMLLTSNLPIIGVIQNAFATLDSFPLLAIPFFILAGNLMYNCGISKRLVNFADSLVGWITGGLALVTILACMFFAAISGSGPATVSAIGSFMIPSMKEKQYNEGFATAITAAAGTIGVIIPPSIPFVLYGVIAGVSVGEMFIAGIIPGIIIGICLMIVSYFITKKQGYGGQDKVMPTGKKVLKSFKEAIWTLIVPIIVLGGIYGGVFTPTEAAVVAVVYSLLIGKFVYKELTIKKMINSFRETVLINGAAVFPLALSMSFARYITMEQIPVKLAQGLLTISTSKNILILIIILFFLIIGCFIDNLSSMIVLTPILLPVMKNFGVDPIHFGIFMCYALAIGFVTPPYGANLFVASGVSGLSVEEISKHIVPFIVSLIFSLILITYIPEISMFLVNLLFR